MTINFQDILKALMVETAPELVEHTTERAKSRLQRGFVGREFRGRRDETGFAVRLVPQGWFEDARKCGQSKQVAREYEANQTQKAIDAIKNFYASESGESARQLAKLSRYLQDAALRIVAQLEKQGYTVMNRRGVSAFNWNEEDVLRHDGE